jgi:peptidoglycan/LPS O-acetylase OafA/YrhL
MTFELALRVRDGLSDGGEPSNSLIAGLMVAAVVVTVVFSVVTYRYIERPFRRWPWRLLGGTTRRCSGRPSWQIRAKIPANGSSGKNCAIMAAFDGEARDDDPGARA